MNGLENIIDRYFIERTTINHDKNEVSGFHSPACLRRCHLLLGCKSYDIKSNENLPSDVCSIPKLSFNLKVLSGLHAILSLKFLSILGARLDWIMPNPNFLVSQCYAPEDCLYHDLWWGDLFGIFTGECLVLGKIIERLWSCSHWYDCTIWTLSFFSLSEFQTCKVEPCIHCLVLQQLWHHLFRLFHHSFPLYKKRTPSEIV